MSAKPPSNSTPIKSNSKATSRQFNGSTPKSDPIFQNDLKRSLREQLGGQTWQLPSEQLARVLSAKERKKTHSSSPTDHPPISPNHHFTVDSIENYECRIDVLESKIVLAQEHFIEQKPHEFLQSRNEQEPNHYAGLARFLNLGLASCADSVIKRGGAKGGEKKTRGKKTSGANAKEGKRIEVQDPDANYESLKFHVWGKAMGDRVDGAHELKPDLAGALGEAEPKMLFWRPQSDDKREVKIPVEAKSEWPDLIAQAATYARAMFSASPLRQFVLVLGYNHKQHAMRFLVFHRGGLTASTPLNLDTKDGQEHFIRLLSAILTWKTRADAGLPAWCNEAQLYLPALRPFAIDIDTVLHHTSCVRGRAPRVYSLRTSQSVDSTALAKPNEATLDEFLEPVSIIQSVRRSKRLQTKAQSDNPIPTPPSQPTLTPVTHRGEGGRVLRDMAKLALDAPGESELTLDMPAPIRIHRALASKKPLLAVIQSSLGSTATPSPLNPSGSNDTQRHQKDEGDSTRSSDAKYCQNENNNPRNHAVLKLSWIPGRGPNHDFIETKLLSECGGMFGVPSHYYSFLAHHQDGCPTTNHLFLPPLNDQVQASFRWDLFTDSNANKDLEIQPERRSLLGHVVDYAGHSLVSAQDLPSLVRAIVHAHLGYYNMCQKGFQHRDISIGNILMVDLPITTEKPFEIENPDDIQIEILHLCEKLKISRDCYGFVIDGDMAIEWESYFKESHSGEKSGTHQFMSTALLRQREGYWHSPLDDYFSFFFVAQWASIFNSSNPPLDMRYLEELRTEIASDFRARDSVTLSMLFKDLDSQEYGLILAQAQPLLRDWYQALMHLDNEWTKMIGTRGVDAKTFREIADRGLKSFLKIIYEKKLL